MKYGNTSRSLSVFFHGLLCVGGLILTLYFGFFVIPTQFIAERAFIDTAMAINLKLELAVIGLSVALISGYGLINGLKALANPRDDMPVLKSFGAFIAEGYVAALFFLLNAVIYWDLTISDGSPAFVIVLALILTIGLLIAANIPMVKLFEGKYAAGMYKGLGYAFAVNAFSITLYSVFLLISLMIAGTGMAYSERMAMILMYIGFSAGVGCFALLAGKFVGNGDKAKLSGLFGCLALFIAGAAFVGIGATELVWDNISFHFSSKNPTLNWSSSSVLTYSVSCMTVGSVVVIASIVALIFNYAAGKKVAHKA